jgi:type IV secretory pathway VirB9-like protein
VSEVQNPFPNDSPATLIVLPEHEEILDVVCGDEISGSSARHNLAHVKPAKDNAATNLNLVTAAGLSFC